MKKFSIGDVTLSSDDQQQNTSMITKLHGNKSAYLLLRSLFRCTSTTANEEYNANCTSVKYQPNGL